MIQKGHFAYGISVAPAGFHQRGLKLRSGDEGEFGLGPPDDLGPTSLLHFIDKLLEFVWVLKVPIDRSEANVGDAIQRLQGLHHQSTQSFRGDLEPGLTAHGVLNLIDHCLNGGQRDGALGTCRSDGSHELGAIILLDSTASLEHLNGSLLHELVGREPKRTGETFPTTTKRAPTSTGTGIHNPVFRRPAVWTAHDERTAKEEGRATREGRPRS